MGLVVIVLTEFLRRSRRRADAARVELADTVNALAKEIDERKRAERETARLASFPMRNPEPVVEVDLDGHVCFANPAAQRLFPDLQQLGPDHPWLSNWDSLANACREPGGSLAARDVAVGERYYHQTMYYMPEVQRVRIYGEDITERKRAEEVLAGERTNLRAVFDVVNVGMMVIDEDGAVKQVNDTLSRWVRKDLLAWGGGNRATSWAVSMR